MGSVSSWLLLVLLAFATTGAAGGCNCQAQETPTRVYGQGGNFASMLTAQLPSANSLRSPNQLFVDPTGRYVADMMNHRVLFYPGTSTTASRVYGQLGSMTMGAKNNGGISADSLNNPVGVAADASGVYIADSLNHRVLHYPGTSTTADRVYGQSDFASNVLSVVSDTGLYFPYGVASNGSGVFVADSGNNRVLFFPGVTTRATVVYGQGGSFSSSNYQTVSGGASAATLLGPSAVAVSAAGIYVADSGNARALFFPADSTTASRVYGQLGSFTTSAQAPTSADSLGYTTVQGVAVASTGLYISDPGGAGTSANNRVLFYPGTSTTATRVYGQKGSFTSNGGTTTADGLSVPIGVGVDEINNLVLIADSSNVRMLAYSGVNTTASVVYGQADSFTSSTTQILISADSLQPPTGVAVDASGTYIGDNLRGRVLFYPGQSITASRVYGQSGSFTSKTTAAVPVSANSLASAWDIALVSGGVYVSDSLDNRVLYFPGTTTTATRVYGQGGSFTTKAKQVVSADSLFNPHGISASSDGFYVADTGSHRVLFFSGANTTASRVYGQNGDFTTEVLNFNGVTKDSLNGPFDVVATSAGVYIADTANFRVLFYQGTAVSASRVYGQPDLISANPGVSANNLDSPYAIAVGDSGVYIATIGRILFYRDASTTASAVFGQRGSFSTSASNNGGLSALSLSDSVFGLALDANGGVYAADYSNVRVLYYPRLLEELRGCCADVQLLRGWHLDSGGIRRCNLL
jgi:sugar lactone lactonase YvrE